MIIKNDFRVYEKFRADLDFGFTRSNFPSVISIHGTGGGQSAAGLFRWMLSGARDEGYRRGIGLFHFLIDFDGSIYRVLPDNIWAHHSHAGAAHRDMVAIELMNSERDNSGHYTAWQYRSLEWLIFENLAKEYDIKYIGGHDAFKRKYAPNRLATTIPCPGAFQYYMLENMTISHNYKITRDDHGGYELEVV